MPNPYDLNEVGLHLHFDRPTQYHAALGSELEELRAENARLTAELAAIKSRRCETCAHSFPGVAGGIYWCRMYKPALQVRYNHSCPNYDPREDADES